MRVSRFIAIFFLIWACSDNSNKPKVNFQITESIIEKAHFDSLRSELLQDKDSILYEDSIYTVRRTCHGEWGGSIWFRNKTTGVEYACAATCPVMVNKINGKYLVITSLAHLVGFSEIIEIQNPEAMEIFKLLYIPHEK